MLIRTILIPILFASSTAAAIDSTIPPVAQAPQPQSQSPGDARSPYDTHPECRDIHNPAPPELCQENNGPGPRVVRGAATRPPPKQKSKPAPKAPVVEGKKLGQ